MQHSTTFSNDRGRPMRTAAAAAAMMLVLACAAPADAQLFGVTDAEKRAPGWVVTPRVSFGLSYDDNPVLAGGGNPTPNDTIGVLGPALNLAYTAKRTQLDFGYSGSLVRYRTLGEFDSFEQRGRMDLRHQASKRTSLQFTNSYAKAPTTDATDVGGVPFLRTGTEQFDLRGGFTADASPRLAVIGSYGYQWAEFDRPDDERAALLQGGQMHSAVMGATYALNGRMRVGGNYTFRRAIVGHIEEEAFNIQDGEGTVAYRLSPTMTLQGGLGLSRLSLPDEFGARLGPSARVSLHQRTPHASYSLSFMHSFVPAFGIGGSLRNSELAGHVRVPLARRVDLQTDVTWREATPVIEGELGLSALWIETTVGYAVHRWLRVQGFYSRAYSDTPVAGGRVDRNRVGVQIVTLRPLRIQ